MTFSFRMAFKNFVATQLRAVAIYIASKAHHGFCGSTIQFNSTTPCRCTPTLFSTRLCLWETFISFHFQFLGMVSPSVKEKLFYRGHAFKYSKNLINNLQLMNTNKKNKIKRKGFMVHVKALNRARFYQPFLEFP